MKIIDKYLEKRRKKQVLEDTYALDSSFIDWLSERLMVYKDEASKIIDLEFHKYQYKGREYTQLQLLDKLIKTTNKLKDLYNNEPDITGKTSDEIIQIYKTYRSKLNRLKREMFEIFSLIFWQLGW